MKRFIFVSILFITITGFPFLSCKQKTVPPEKAITETLLTQTDSFAALCKKLKTAIQSETANAAQLQSLFLKTRLAYKNFEWAVEYFVPVTSRFVNGPPVQEVEISGRVIEPAGLQVIESYLFPSYAVKRKAELVQQLDNLRSACENYHTFFSTIAIFDWQVFDAVKQEVFRIITLGITGFDNPLTQKSMAEAAASLESLQKVISYYTDNHASENLNVQFTAAIHYLKTNTNFNTFNRAEFITMYCNPISKSISRLEQELSIHVIKYNRLLNQDAYTLFDTNAFNINAYAPDQTSFITTEKVALGKLLFADPVLSGNGKRSCQSCHQPEKAFSDGFVKNTVIGNRKLLKRNTPTLLNSALQPALFYDLRVNRLEEQAQKVVQNAEEMHGSLMLCVKELWQNKLYRQLFAAAFPKKNRTSIDTLEVMNAIGSYVRSLVLLNSRFDEYMRGNKMAMNEEEINGFNLFTGKARCATCHYLPLFNGTFPPRYIKTEAEVIGVPQSTLNDAIDEDMGRFDILKVESFKHAFKTPTIRNVSRTAPYMHNGVFTTLTQVMDFYNKGGGAGLGLKITNQTLPADSLKLTLKESNAIIAFIKSLDSR